ncbi:NUDIX hydrolase [Pontibacillus halophilus JSM 076056 = DSM 19796]|uniref:NUDIX hydrolase n=1 Tax=Pontibacillus halophilus JSM 076056 = DSM 19796 TaxID=1385510 RepID=A0A0A5I5M2_9BACI|nr:NUDIX domain-containing protein [Pontibacillus halophilus]KGX91127.1 NUDIX hydrolase [Pontibacillus halophilus JSM 076056 = DSM 19796]
MITKIGAAIINEGKLLVVSKKKHPDQYMLPGGKPENGENEIGTLKRELFEELQIEVTSHEKLGTYRTTSMFDDEELHLTVYLTEIEGQPTPSSEIDAFQWISIEDEEACADFGSGIRHFTLPLLRERMSS